MSKLKVKRVIGTYSKAQYWALIVDGEVCLFKHWSSAMKASQYPNLPVRAVGSFRPVSEVSK